MYTHKYDRTTKTWLIKNPKGRVIATGMSWRVARKLAKAMECQYTASQAVTA